MYYAKEPVNESGPRQLLNTNLFWGVAKIGLAVTRTQSYKSPVLSLEQTLNGFIAMKKE